MNEAAGALTWEERVIFTLRSLYARYGYHPYKMSKFEEYDLYVRNKDFLISDSVITFTDTTGQLMALKPDVTLSIIKNTRDEGASVRKLYYNENVYRVSKSSGSFRELMQVGLECIGGIGAAEVSEVLWLAASSLSAIRPEFVLDVSHLGLVGAVLAKVPADAEKPLLVAIGEKNPYGIADAAREYGIDPETERDLKALATLAGTPDEVLPKLDSIADRCGAEEALSELKTVLSVFDGSPLAAGIRVDASVLDDMKYYNGIVFKGFLRGVPESVLSGGQYDRLMRRMHRDSRAIGFAVYLDSLERMEADGGAPLYDADVLLLHDPDVSPAALRDAKERFIREGLTVRSAAERDPNLRVGRTVKLTEINGAWEVNDLG